ncbi:peptidase M28 [Meridianimaribacter sp. CL38]|uniref:M28 family peptidase n=1 Tax=Meridianimaribacter sp. CL38 TaxID=2213021 RepID=UPI00103C3818|nr:M28 family peptidase [Meridianimaribacter sp. CL38]TBV28175.1 peptidase M28 [Meridianimaribacter sp. CL38]
MFKKIIAFLLIIIAIYWSFSALMPNKISQLDADDNTFSTQRALVHLKEISKAPHYVGSPEHENVRNYIVKELEKLGLETQVQDGYSYNKKWGSLTKPKNILARLKGTDNSKALMLLTHYDSNPHSSIGSSDAGSGVVTILEGLRAYLHEGKQPKNDIIILISDAEELGLNGAELFVNNHAWAKDVGLVLNFEARGSGGPSYMLIETNGGNQNMVKGFIEANPKYPVANSLAYSVYKKLPNDTDLTIFREDGDIEGFNFAFIDDHFDYHTALDNYERLDRETLEHQGSYLMPLLHYFSDTNLNNLKSDVDDVYFNVPLFKTVSYPNTWIFPMLIIAIVLFIALVFYGIKKRMLNSKHMLIGILPGIAALVINGVIGYFGWSVLKAIYPQYNEILHGFTYNGYIYILAFTFLSAGVCMWLYNKVYKPENTASLVAPPLLLWIVISAVMAFELKGASFLIIPVYFGLVSLFILVRQKHPNLFLMALLLFPALMILSPFVKMFPVGLGLKTIIATTLLVSLIFSLCISLFGFSRYKNRWSYLLFFLAICCFISAHLKSDFNEERPKPNSLVYILDSDKNEAVWATYDNILDPWTESYLTDNPDHIDSLSKFTIASKYKTQFTFTKKANIKPLKHPYIDVKKDTIVDGKREIKLFISPQRNVNRLELFSDSTNVFLSFNVNGYTIPKAESETYVFENRRFNRLFSYFVADDKFLELEFTVPENQSTKIDLLEASFDMLDNPLFRVPKRPADMIPKPFVLNDAVVIKKTIQID